VSEPTPTEQETTLADLKRWVLAFTRERNWDQFHHPKDLGLALAIEVGEVLEHFRYRTNEQIERVLVHPETHREFGHELADCLWLLVRLADVCGVDLAGALREKLDLAALKYPVEKVYGRSDKYTAYREEAPSIRPSAPAPSPDGNESGPSVA
jgi:dCTP diphosphatase